MLVIRFLYQYQEFSLQNQVSIMFVSFDTLPDNARIWVYQANRKFLPEEEKAISETIRLFCEGWSAHGQPLRTSFQIDHQQFLILAVDEAAADASGCSIDGSVRMLKEIQARFNLDFFDRTKVAFLLRDEVRLFPMAELKQAFGSGALNSTSITFNTLVATKGQMANSWVIQAGKTWLSKYLPKTAVA